MNFRKRKNLNISVGTHNKDLRDSWLKKVLLEIEPGKSILDAGAGELQYKKFCEHLNYISQDFGEYDGEGNQAGLQTGSFDNSKIDIKSDIASIPVDSNTFDAVLCVEVFEHIPHPIDALKELHRVLKKDGVLILTTPFWSLTHYAPFHFHTGYTKYWFKKYLTDIGFEIIEITPNGGFFENIAQEVRRIPSVAEKYTDVKLDRKDSLTLDKILEILEKLNKDDSGSSELLTYGFHVRAKKLK